ncbi:anthranilate synthase component II [Mariniradius sediminis]|uniref:Aminodeoxychorismate/anthranilate synthase component II n=1 Tax=Mariniradius sediminis TaxID=2909237 RepID=A0ABS9BVN3_9BACT|nr:aminodeoxychorismate/anthranilate synthase component II [Mariniradius sediminis]MCF1751400.1 aminodeoxychorismate/anthranilate synthase component II [Mariniradius sediminis]
MVLLIDNFDSFSHILADYLLQTGIPLKIVRNDQSLHSLTAGNWEGLILSPGPESPEKAGNLMEILGHFAEKVPILGICLGHQAIGLHWGATLAKGKQPVHGKVHAVKSLSTHEILSGLPESFMVTRYHSLLLTELPDCLEVLLETNDGEVMAIAHRELPILGIQYHPEAYLTEFGKEIIQNWLRWANILPKTL